MTQSDDQAGLATSWWWAASAVMGLAVGIDALDGEPLKLATSLLLLIVFVVIAATQRRRTRTAKVVIGAGVACAVAVLLYRLFGPGL